MTNNSAGYEAIKGARFANAGKKFTVVDQFGNIRNAGAVYVAFDFVL